MVDKARQKKFNKTEALKKVKNSSKKVLQSGLRIKDFEDFKSKALTAVFVVGGSYATWRFMIKPQWQKYKQNKENEKIFTDPNAQQASVLRQAIIGVGTDENAVMKMAHQITNWKAVQQSYQKLTGNSLNEDLKGDLSSKEYNLFISIVNRNAKVKIAKSKRGYIVVSSKDVRVRNTPDSSISAYSFNSNILGTVKTGNLLGFATGKVIVDKRGVQYHQIRIKFTASIPYSHSSIYKKQKSRILSFWAGAGAIELYREFKQMRESFPNVKIAKGTKDTGLRQALRS